MAVEKLIQHRGFRLAQLQFLLLPLDLEAAHPHQVLLLVQFLFRFPQDWGRLGNQPKHQIFLMQIVLYD